MRLLKLTNLFLVWYLTALQCISFALVKEDNLLVRWAFDEGNGSLVADSVGNSATLFLDPAVTWGWEGNGTALSHYSMDLSEAQGFGYAEPNENLQVTSSFSLLLWFKTNGIPDDWSQLLGKRETLSFSYFTQINPGGESIETSFRVLGQDEQFTSTGPVGYSLDKWNCLICTYDGRQLQTFLNGKLVGSIGLTQIPEKDNGNLGIGGSPDGSNLFKGWIDEIRFYDSPLNASDALLAYGDGFGDLGASPAFSAVSSTDEENSTVLLSFLHSNGSLASVTGLSAEDFLISGASLTEFEEVNSTHYRIVIRADQKPSRMIVRVPAGCARDDGNFSVSSGSTRIS